MSEVTSAVPADLATFVSDGARLRAPLATTSTSLSALQKQVLAASPDYGVAGSTLPSVDSTLSVMAYNEASVDKIHTELLAADHATSGPVTVADTAVALALVSQIACDSLSNGAKSDFSTTYTCPLNRVEVRARSATG